MVKDFKDKDEWAIILGASGGLGLATAHKLASQGLNLCLIYRERRSKTESIESEFANIKNDNGIQLTHFNCDVIKPESREKVTDLMHSLGGRHSVKAIVHSIAKGNLKPMNSMEGPELQNDDFHLTIENMALSLYDWVKKIHAENLFSKDARVISFTSMGSRRAWENYAAVSAAKATLESLTRAIALEYAQDGIRANCIEAGVTDTASLRMIPGSEKLKKHSRDQNPFRRLTQPEDVANVVYLLLKDEASWINGAIIPVNGGEHLK